MYGKFTFSLEYNGQPLTYAAYKTGQKVDLVQSGDCTNSGEFTCRYVFTPIAAFFPEKTSVFLEIPAPHALKWHTTITNETQPAYVREGIVIMLSHIEASILHNTCINISLKGSWCIVSMQFTAPATRAIAFANASVILNHLISPRVNEGFGMISSPGVDITPSPRDNGNDQIIVFLDGSIPAGKTITIVAVTYPHSHSGKCTYTEGAFLQAIVPTSKSPAISSSLEIRGC